MQCALAGGEPGDEAAEPCARSQAALTDKKAGFSYLLPGGRGSSSFFGIIPVKAGWLVGLHQPVSIIHA